MDHYLNLIQSNKLEMDLVAGVNVVEVAQL